jgi:hypothetical protein
LLRNTYYEPLQFVFQNFCNTWLRCSYSVNDYKCCNVKSSHTKGHQGSNGRIFARGAFQSDINVDDFFPEWIDDIDNRITELNEHVQKLAVDRDEKSSVSTTHKDVMALCYKMTGSVMRLTSHLTCFSCVCNTPENELPCGHTLCKACVQSYGKNTGQGLFELNSCPLHPETRFSKPAQIRFKPPEAGVRVLCLDG